MLGLCLFGAPPAPAKQGEVMQGEDERGASSGAKRSSSDRSSVNCRRARSRKMGRGGSAWLGGVERIQATLDKTVDGSG